MAAFKNPPIDPLDTAMMTEPTAEEQLSARTPEHNALTTIQTFRQDEVNIIINRVKGIYLRNMKVPNADSRKIVNDLIVPNGKQFKAAVEKIENLQRRFHRSIWGSKDFLEFVTTNVAAYNEANAQPYEARQLRWKKGFWLHKSRFNKAFLTKLLAPLDKGIDIEATLQDPRWVKHLGNIFSVACHSTSRGQRLRNFKSLRHPLRDSLRVVRDINTAVDSSCAGRPSLDDVPVPGGGVSDIWTLVEKRRACQHKMRLSWRIVSNDGEPGLEDSSSHIHAEQEHNDDALEASRDGWQQANQHRPRDETSETFRGMWESVRTKAVGLRTCNQRQFGIGL